MVPFRSPAFRVLAAAILVIFGPTNAYISPLPTIRRTSPSIPFHIKPPHSKARISPTVGILPLRASNNGDVKGFKKSFLDILQRISTSPSRWIHTYGPKLNSGVKRFALALFATVFLWFSSSGYQPPPANAVSPPTAIQKILPSPSLDKMVDRYVKDYMFDDDVYDPVESTIRETFEDATSGEYPKALEDITVGIFGKRAIKRDESGNGIIKVVKVGEQILVRLGLSELAAQVALATTTFALIAGSFVTAIGLLGASIKGRMGRKMKRRYGDDFTMDASKTVKKPDDDDDDGDDDDGDDDDFDDDDDDDY